MNVLPHPSFWPYIPLLTSRDLSAQIKYHRLTGIMILVLADKDICKDISQVSAHKVATGMLNFVSDSRLDLDYRYTLIYSPNEYARRLGIQILYEIWNNICNHMFGFYLK